MYSEQKGQNFGSSAACSSSYAILKAVSQLSQVCFNVVMYPSYSHEVSSSSGYVCMLSVVNGISNIQSGSLNTYSPARSRALFLFRRDAKSDAMDLVAAPSGVA